MTFNTRKLLLSTCRVLKSPSSFFWVTEGSVLLTDNYKNQAFLGICKENNLKCWTSPSEYEIWLKCENMMSSLLYSHECCVLITATKAMSKSGELCHCYVLY